MLSKISRLQNVGLLRDATATRRVDLAKFTAIYGENGRGKSTLASVLRACTLKDGERLMARKTFGSKDDPRVSILLSNKAMVEYEGGTWKGPVPNIVVYDPEFVEMNVYSGCEVRSDQKQSLLSFALGADAVKLKQRVDAISEAMRERTTARSSAEKALKSHAGSLKVDQFIALPRFDDIELRIDALQNRLEAAKRADLILRRPEPELLSGPECDLDTVFALLGQGIDSVEEAAEALVREHLDKFLNREHRAWVSDGQKFLGMEVCPFCGQSLRGVDLIRAYRGYFNQAYSDLEAKTEAQMAAIEQALGPAWIGVLEQRIKNNAERIEAWADQIALAGPSIETEDIGSQVRSLRELLLSLLTAKKEALLAVPVDEGDYANAVATLAAIREVIGSYNRALEVVIEQIREVKKTIASDDLGKLQTEIANLQASQRRWTPEVVALVEEYTSASNERRQLEAQKEAARKEADALMKATLKQYQADINRLLLELGAEFQIVETKPTYIGSGEPRVDYQIALRDETVPLGKRDDLVGGRGFATVLSEGDKRTLALAFFLARLEADGELPGKVVVFDDPMCSLDYGRKASTRRLVLRLLDRCTQLIVLSHDAYFVRDLVRQLRTSRIQESQLRVLKLETTVGGDSIPTTCDIEDLCCSEYYRHYRMVEECVTGANSADTRDVAKALRPLLEGYLHRRFPCQVRREATLGEVIEDIAVAQPPNPLAYLKSRVEEWRDMNDYAKQFHHDGDRAGEVSPVSSTELRLYAKRALALIQQG